MRLFCAILICLTNSLPLHSQTLQLAANRSTKYSIYVGDPSTASTKAATVLQDYFYRVTGARLAITKNRQEPYFNIVSTPAKENGTLKKDGYLIKTEQQNIVLSGNTRGVLYAVYDFIERFMNCRKWDGGKSITPKKENLSIPARIDLKENPSFQFREVYMPPAFDDEYLDWHKLNRFENDWGLWGHSYFKLIPPQKYFNTHPEYFSLVGGKRQPLQLCLSDAAVLKLVVADLSKRMLDNSDALYWSVSANDDIGYCECTRCRASDDTDGGPQGSLLRFVNAVAANFPNKLITTLAYGYSARAPRQTKAADNVVVMLSSIDALRSVPLQSEATAEAFRKNLSQWREKAKCVFTWDYCTQFTNYLTPFPSQENFASDLLYLKENNVSGIFQQGSGDTHSDMAGLKTYLSAKLLWNPSLDADSIKKQFLAGYYGKAATVVNDYLVALKKNISASQTSLDIYGNPINDHSGYLSPEHMEAYSTLLDRAETVVGYDAYALAHLQALRLSQEYVYLQQLKFYGKDKHGLYQKNNGGDFELRKGLAQRLAYFKQLAQQSNVKEMAEGGISSNAYLAEWETIMEKGVQYNLAADAKVTLAHSFAPEYPAKKERTLVDETPGYVDFSYNWLCFYGVPLEAQLDLHAVKKIKKISLHFLSDARHWIFPPSSVTVSVSKDGIVFRPVKTIAYDMEEDFTPNSIPFAFAVDETVRYISVKAVNPGIPTWRYHPRKKAIIACDEVWVE